MPQDFNLPYWQTREGALQQQNLLNQQNKFGWNPNTIQMGLSGLGSLASAYAAFKQLGQAKKEFEFNKGIANTNLNNTIQSYNTAIADRARSVAEAKGNTPLAKAEAAEYVRLNSLAR